MDAHLAIAVFTFALVSGSSYAAIGQLERRVRRLMLMRRLARSGQDLEDYERQRRLAPAKNLLLRLGVAAMPRREAEVTDLRRLLGCAGYRSANAPVLYYGFKLALAIACGLGYLAIVAAAGMLGVRSLILAFFPMAAGYYLPGGLLQRRIKARQTLIFHELPDVLDLLLVCMAAGLSFDMALNRVSRELRSIAPVLSSEFVQYFLEIQSGLPRGRVLQNLAERNGEKGLAGVVQVLQQSQRFGTEVAEALAAYGENMRTQRRQEAEEKAAKISTRITFPMILLVLPALMLVILGPAFINLAERLF